MKFYLSYILYLNNLFIYSLSLRIDITEKNVEIYRESSNMYFYQNIQNKALTYQIHIIFPNVQSIRIIFD